MYTPGTRLYVESEGIPQGGHGIVVPTPGHYLPSDHILMVQYAPATAHRVELEWAIPMRDLHTGSLSGHRTTVRPDEWLCPPEWVCQNCRQIRARPTTLAHQRPARLSWSAKAHHIQDEDKTPFWDILGEDTFARTYQQLTEQVREIDAILRAPTAEFLPDECHYHYEVLDTHGEQIATAQISAELQLDT